MDRTIADHRDIKQTDRIMALEAVTDSNSEEDIEGVEEVSIVERHRTMLGQMDRLLLHKHEVRLCPLCSLLWIDLLFALFFNTFPRITQPRSQHPHSISTV